MDPDQLITQHMQDAKILTAYFSSGKDYSFATVHRRVKGHTEQMAEMIQEALGGTLYRINPMEALQKEREYIPYPIKDFQSYDIIFLGYPIWYGTFPPMVKEFLQSYDVAGKVIIPFATHSGSGLGDSVKQIRTLCPASFVKEGKAIASSQVQIQKTEIQNWAADAMKIQEENRHDFQQK